MATSKTLPAIKDSSVVYTLRKDGIICDTSTMPGCGYSAQELRQLRAAGFVLYADEAVVKE